MGTSTALSCGSSLRQHILFYGINAILKPNKSNEIILFLVALLQTSKFGLEWQIIMEKPGGAYNG